MRSPAKLVLGLLIGAAGLYGAWAAVRAHRDLVTLNVRNMEVRRVIRKIEWQTWESISVHKEVQGKITLQVRKVPLEEVLRIIGEQTSSRWGAFYPLYSSRKSLAAFKKSLRGEEDLAARGWTNLQSRPFLRGGPMFGRGGPMFGRGGPMFGGGGPMGAPAPQPPPRVSLQIQHKDVPFVTLALNRYTQARVVPEDGTTGVISFTLDQVTIGEAVAQFAKQTSRRWTKLYGLRSDGPPDFARGGPGPEGRRGREGWEPSSEQREQFQQFRQQRASLEEELKQTLPAAERERVEQAQQQREQQWEEMRNLSPEQRRERFAQMGGAGRDQRMLDRIKNTTPEQRLERYRRMDQMRQRRQQGGPR